MESAFFTFLKLGRDHILDVNGLDHLLFIVALCATYQLTEWKKVAILVTAFTIGHSLMLALAALGIITFPAQLMEWLILITILLTAVYNLWLANKATGDRRYLEDTSYLNSKYGIALFFGLIHGMAFSNFFKSTLFPGQEGELVRQLLAFNIGVEIGQLIIVGTVLLIAYIAMTILKIKQIDWLRGISISVILATFYLLYQL